MEETSTRPMPRLCPGQFIGYSASDVIVYTPANPLCFSLFSFDLINFFFRSPSPLTSGANRVAAAFIRLQIKLSKEVQERVENIIIHKKLIGRRGGVSGHARVFERRDYALLCADLRLERSFVRLFLQVRDKKCLHPSYLLEASAA